MDISALPLKYEGRADYDEVVYLKAYHTLVRSIYSAVTIFSLFAIGNTL